jgi:hypothetical protein
MPIGNRCRTCGAAVIVWSTWDLPTRYLGAVVAILVLAGAFLAKSNDL